MALAAAATNAAVTPPAPGQATVGDKVVVQVDSAPLMSGANAIGHIDRDTRLTVQGIEDPWILVSIRGRRGTVRARIHQNHVALPDTPQNLGNQPVPLANILGATEIRGDNVDLLVNLNRSIQDAMLWGREQEILRHGQELIDAISRYNQRNPLFAEMLVQMHGILSEAQYRAGNQRLGRDHGNRAYALAVAAQGIAANSGPVYDGKVFSFIRLQSSGGLSESRYDRPDQGEVKVANACAELDRLLTADKLATGNVFVDGTDYTDHADVLIRVNQVPKAETQVEKALRCDAAFKRNMAKLNLSGTQGHPECLRAICRVYQKDEEGAIKQMDAGQRAIQRWYIWSGHVQDPNFELNYREMHGFPTDHLSELFNYGLSLARHSSARAGIAEIAAAWALNRKHKTEGMLQRQMRLVRRDGVHPSRLPPLLIHDAAVGEKASADWLVSMRGLTACFGLRYLPSAESDEARQEFETLRYLGAALKGTGLWNDDVPKGVSLFERTPWNDREAERRWVDVHRIRSCLSPKQALIEFVRFNEFDYGSLGREYRWLPARYAAWVMTAKGPVTQIDLGEAAALEESIENLRGAIRAAGGKTGTIATQGEPEALQALNPAIQDLADKLLTPLKPHVKTCEELILGLDGSLWLLPWAALPWSEKECLLERFKIRIVMTGAQLIPASQAPESQSQDALPLGEPMILAGPNFDSSPDEVRQAERTVLGEEFPAPPVRVARRGTSVLPAAEALPFSVAEATEIAPHLARYTGGKPRVYVGNEAVEALISRAKRPRVLVLSTHGFFLPSTMETDAAKTLTIRDPTMRCGLLFAGCNQQDQWPYVRSADGILTGYEVEALDLEGTELVVLSACDTGVGDVRTVEGVVGLRESFHTAGAKAVLATLWQVSDRDTALIMVKFFENLAAGQSQPDALRNAQLSRMAERRERNGAAHPLFWAAFTLTGG